MLKPATADPSRIGFTAGDDIVKKRLESLPVQEGRDQRASAGHCGATTRNGNGDTGFNGWPRSFGRPHLQTSGNSAPPPPRSPMPCRNRMAGGFDEGDGLASAGSHRQVRSRSKRIIVEDRVRTAAVPGLGSFAAGVESLAPHGTAIDERGPDGFSLSPRPVLPSVFRRIPPATDNRRAP